MMRLQIGGSVLSMVRLVLEVLDDNDCYFKQNKSYKVGPYQLEVGL